MMSDVQKLLDEYSAWLKNKTHLRAINDQWVEITTPYLDRHNDYLQIYARRDGGGYILTDDGYIIQDLESSGCNLDNKRRQDLLHLTLNGFGVKQDKKALIISASASNFFQRKHNLLQAMLAVNDLFYLASPIVASLFLEDVTAWLDGHDIRYTPNVKFTGKGGLDYIFDFVIPKSREQPERILRAINRPDTESARSVAFSWIDTRETRPPDSRAYALLNDTERPLGSSALDTLRSYAVTPVLWSKRENVVNELAA